MPEFRYHRMTENRFGWKRPHTGRLGIGNDEVSKQGFGHEDWNFARDVWDDDKYHLYLRTPPSREDLEKTFNIVLGLHTKLGAMIIGFAENVTYGEAKLSDEVWQRRALEIKVLEEGGQLGSKYSGKSVRNIKNMLTRRGEIYNVSVAPSDLHVIERPTLIPDTAFKIRNHRYQLLRITANDYEAATQVASGADIKDIADFDDDTSFPEGAQVERLHRFRERSRKLVKLAKEAFMRRHNGSLHCEACCMEPSKHFKVDSLAGKIIEAHHNVNIADAAHSGATRIEDLTMLCPSCHRAIHSIRPWLSVAQLRKRLKG